jgi:hypothetical protein
MSDARPGAVEVRVSGAATPEDVAAIVATLQLRRATEPPTSRFERWRRQRLAVLRDNR